METEKEIELNKERIKELEFEISDQEIKAQSLAIDLEKNRYEYNLLMDESIALKSKLNASKKDYIFQVKDLINNPAASRTRMIRKYMANIIISGIQEGDTSNFAELSKWARKMRKKYKRHPLFEIEYLSSDKIIEISTKANVHIGEIVTFSDLEDRFFLYSPELIIKDEESTKLMPAVSIEIPKSGKLILIEYASLDNYELMNKAKDKISAKKYLEQFTKELRNQIDKIYNINYKNNDYVDDDSIEKVILYFEYEDALKNAIKQDPDILEYALEKDIEISFPMLFLGITNFISHNLEKKDSKERFKRYEHIREQLIEKKTREIKERQAKISQLLKINFEYLKSPSYQVKVTLNHEENYVLEELVNKKGSNKSSVLRQILMEYKDISDERDNLKIVVEKLNLEKKFIQDRGISDLREIKIEHELAMKDLETELKRKLLEITHQREVMDNEHEAQIKILKNELIFKTEQYQSINSSLKDEFYRREEYLKKSINSIKESIENNKQSLKESELKNAVKVINPKEIKEFGNIMELINQNILILCDTSSIDNKDRQRFIDMVYGGVYGLKGKIKKVSNNMFLYIPQTFDLFDD